METVTHCGPATGREVNLNGIPLGSLTLRPIVLKPFRFASLFTNTCATAAK
jgi:hypothetical protein